MVARTARQAVIPGSRFDWRKGLSRLRSVLLIVSAMGLLVLGVMKLNDPAFLPIKKVRAQGAFVNLTEEMLLHKAGNIQGGYFNIDVKTVQKNIESLAWVDKAYVRRIWPDTLLIRVLEQQPTAVWQGKGLLNIRGELFYPELKKTTGPLPLLFGPAGSHRQLLEHYKTMSAMLTATGLVIQQIEIDARRAMVLHMTQGLKLVLGHDGYYARLERFIRVYKKILAVDIDNIRQIDMRYTNGFTLLRKQ